MKKSVLFLVLALAASVVPSAYAQYLGTNSFTSSSDITSLSQYSISTNSGAYAVTGSPFGVLEYTASAPESSRVLIMNDATNSAYTEDWTAKLVLTNLAVPTSGYNLISLQVFAAGGYEYGFFNIGLYRAASGTAGVLFEKGRTTDGTVDTYGFTSYISSQVDFSNVLVVMSHNAATKDVTLGYSLDGGATYHADTATFNPNSIDDGGAWYAAPTGGYSFRILARNTQDADIGSGLMVADNFSVTAGMTAVPEPSTYAAIAGLGALGLAFWRRRQKAAAKA